MALVVTAWMFCADAATQLRRHITVTTMELLVGEATWNRMKKIAILISLVGVAGLITILWGPMMKVLNAPHSTGSAFAPYTPPISKQPLFWRIAFIFCNSSPIWSRPPANWQTRPRWVPNNGHRTYYAGDCCRPVHFDAC